MQSYFIWDGSRHTSMTTFFQSSVMIVNSMIPRGVVIMTEKNWIGTQAAQAQDVNKLFNSDIVTQRTIYRDCMGNLPLC